MGRGDSFTRGSGNGGGKSRVLDTARRMHLPAVIGIWSRGIRAAPRTILGIIGTSVILVSLLTQETFRWGRRGQGPAMKPQWVGRLFFGFIGGIMLYVALRGFG